MVNVVLGTTYDITTKYPEVFGSRIEKLTVISTDSNYELVSTIKPTIRTELESVKAVCGVNDPINSASVTGLTYIIFKDANNNKIALAKEYIDTAVPIGNEYIIKITKDGDNVGLTDKAVIKNYLNNTGFNVEEL